MGNARRKQRTVATPAKVPRRAPSLASKLRYSNNSFGFLRLFFASVVVFSHSFNIGGFGKEPAEWLSGDQVTLGVLAVYGFFIVSGYLITLSSLSKPSVLQFLWHRALRILPGYWLCLFITAFCFAPLLYGLETGGMPSIAALWNPRPSPVDYVFSNLFLQFNVAHISNLLATAKFPWGINGSLWTLQYEAVCYLVVAALATFGVHRRSPGVVVGLMLAVWLYCVVDVTWSEVPNFVFRGSWLLKLGVFFLVGSCVALYAEKIPSSPVLLGMSVLLLGVSFTNDTFIFVGPFAFAYLVFYAAAHLNLSSVGRKRDLSYGIYLYAFPIQQSLAAAGLDRFGLIVFAAVSLALSAGLALLSYWLVEAPALRLKSIDFI